MKTKRGFAVVLGALGVVAVPAIVATQWVFPLEWAGLKQRIELRWAGVERFRAGEFDGLERNHCEGDGECVCVALLHGMADSALTWRKLLALSRKEWGKATHLFAFHLPGSPERIREEKPEDLGARAQARKLKDALAPLCPRWMVVGNSFGGWIAAWLGLDWPEGISKIVLASPAGLSFRRNPRVVELLSNPTAESLKEFQKLAYHKPRPLPDSVFAEAARRAREAKGASVRDAQKPEDFLDSKLSAMKPRVMLVWGDSDRVTPPEDGDAWYALMPGNYIRRIAECGHLPQKECPDQLMRYVNELLRAGAM